MATETDGQAADASSEPADVPAESVETDAADPATDADEEGLDSYRRSVTVTTLSTLLGIAAGILSAMFTSGPSDPIAVLILGALVAVQLPVLDAIGIDTDDFGTKDNLYIIFMTFALWFVTWTLLMTVGAF